MIALRLNMVLTTPATPRHPLRTFVICDINWESGELALAEQFPEAAPDQEFRYHRKPKVMPCLTLQKKIQAGSYAVSDQPLNPHLIHARPITSKMIQCRDDNWALVQTIIEQKNLLRLYLYGGGLGTLLSDHCSAHGRCEKHFYNTLHHCLSLGGVLEACTPDWGRNAHALPATVKKPGKKRGRKPRYAVIEYRNWTQDDSTALKKFIPKVKNFAVKTKIDLYVEFCFDVLKVVVDVIGTSRVAVLVPGERGLVSLTQFYYHLAIDVPYLKQLEMRVGRVNFRNNHRGVPGSARYFVRGPTVRYEIDATVSSIYLRYALSDEYRWSVGKPHVYVVIDVFSTMIVGFYVTFLDEQWTAASQALYNAMSNKVDFCREFDIDITEEEWPCCLPCEEFTFDRAGLYSNNHVESLLKSEAGTQRANMVPAWTGSAKGIVEAAIRKLESETKKMPGAVRKDRRDLAHASNNALFTYRDFVQALIDVVREHNNRGLHMYLLDGNMTRHEVRATRREVWNYALKHYIGDKEPIPADTLRFGLLPEGEAVITAKGVSFKGRYYENDACLDYFSMARSTHREPITIRYTKTTVNYVFWRSPEGHSYMLELTNDSRRFRDACHEDALIRNYLEKLCEAREWPLQLAARIHRHVRQKQRIANARKEVHHTESSDRKSPQPGVKARKAEAKQAESQRMQATILQELGLSIADLDTETQASLASLSDTVMDALLEQMYPDADTLPATDSEGKAT